MGLNTLAFHPNEHAARQLDSAQGDRFTRQNDALGAGVSVVWTHRRGQPIEAQSIRFDKDRFTSAAALAWLTAHGFKVDHFEPAAGTPDTAAAGTFDPLTAAPGGMLLCSAVGDGFEFIAAAAGEGAAALHRVNLTA